MERDDQGERQEDRRDEGSRTEGHLAALRAIAYLSQRVERFPDRPEEEQAEFLRGLGVSASDSALVRELGRMMPERLGPELQRLCLPWPVTECELGWYPSVLAPVFNGMRDFDTGHGAPVKLRVFYPSTDGSVDNAPFLANCGAYPLVILLHGFPPNGSYVCSDETGREIVRCDHTTMHAKWELLPAVLARSGYVVVVPQLTYSRWPWHAENPDLDTVRRVLNWMRFHWEHRNHLMGPAWTGVVGHSYGALLGARLATMVPVSAYVSLSGAWDHWQSDELRNPLGNLNVPGLFTWGNPTQDPVENTTAQLDGAQWDAIAPPKHKLNFLEGYHWDYLRPDPPCPPGSPPPVPKTCGQDRGPCNLVGGLAADFATMFMSKYLPPERHSTLSNLITEDLMPPANVRLTVEQQFFAVAHLSSLSLICIHNTCSVTHEWETVDGSTDTHTLSAGTC